MYGRAVSRCRCSQAADYNRYNGPQPEKLGDSGGRVFRNASQAGVGGEAHFLIYTGGARGQATAMLSINREFVHSI